MTIPNPPPPSIEEVIAAGYAPEPASRIVAQAMSRREILNVSPGISEEGLQEKLKASEFGQTKEWADQVLADYHKRQLNLASAAAERPKHSGECRFDEARELRSSGPSAGQLLALMRRQMELTLTLTGHVGDGQVAAWFRDLAEFEAEVAAHEAV